MYSFTQAIFPAKGKVFNDQIVPRIDIKINVDSLQDMLSQENEENTHEYPADFIWNDGVNKDTVKNIGFRLRGNTSRQSQKKSFKVKFDKFKGIKYEGLSEMNLNGEHNDPSIIRSKLVWDLMSMAEIEAPRSNHVQLYINGEYRGLYINVEHIDNNYLKSRRKNTSGQLFKCLYGSDFVYRGNSPTQYSENVYEPANNQNNVTYDDLIQFTKLLETLNSSEDRCEFEKKFDIDRYLKIMALEILVGHWDNTIYNINNSYLYFNDNTGKLEIISYDTDNTFGIDWFDIDWAQRNIYSWAKSNTDRPLYNNILKVPEYRIRFGYHVDQFIKKFYNPTFLNAYIDNIRNKISPYVQNDFYASLDYGYNFNDFINSYNTALGGHVKNGLKEFIDLRSKSAASQLQNIAISPFISDLTILKEKENITFSITSQNNAPVKIYFNYRLDNGAWKITELLDNGIQPDDKINDGNYTFQLPFTNEKYLYYFIELKDQTGKQERLPYCDNNIELLAYSSEIPIYINEFMADNDIISDDENEFEDWIELYNASEKTINLLGLFLSDDVNNPSKWPFPDFEIPGKSFLIFWADEDKSQGLDHCNFKLSKEGEFIGIFEGASSGFAPIDTFHYSEVEKNISYGRLKDGLGPISKLNEITFDATNEITVTKDEIVLCKIFPNPAQDILGFHSTKLPEIISIYNGKGQIVYTEKPTSLTTDLDVSMLAAGIYIVAIQFDGKITSGNYLIIH